MSGVVHHRGFDELMIESNHLTLLIELIISVNILQGIYAIGATFDAFDDEMTTTIRATYTQHGLFFKGRVSQICIETDKDSFHGFEVFGCNDITRDLHRVDFCTRRKAVSVVTEGVTLVVIADGITEINGISGVGFQRIEQLNFDRFACSLNLRSL